MKEKAKDRLHASFAWHLAAASHATKAANPEPSEVAIRAPTLDDHRGPLRCAPWGRVRRRQRSVPRSLQSLFMLRLLLHIVFRPRHRLHAAMSSISPSFFPGYWSRAQARCSHILPVTQPTRLERSDLKRSALGGSWLWRTTRGSLRNGMRRHWSLV